MSMLSDFRDSDDKFINGGTPDQQARHNRIANLNSALGIPGGVNLGNGSVEASRKARKAIAFAAAPVVDAEIVAEADVLLDRLRKSSIVANCDAEKVNQVVSGWNDLSSVNK